MDSSLTRRSGRMIAATVLCSLAGLAGAGSAGADTSSFVVGDNSAVFGAHVTFWGAQWWKLNSLSGGRAPAAFKGFADDVLSASCGSSWTSDPGNSSDPPEGPLPGLLEAVVSSQIVKSGRTISGDVTELVLIATEPGYAPDPGHPGTGTVVGFSCGGGGIPS
jgi:hypothetical protein